MNKLDNLFMEAAYLAGYEPSRDDLTEDEMSAEAENYLCNPSNA